MQASLIEGLVAELAEGLEEREPPLEWAAETIRARLGVDRVSISAIDAGEREEPRFEIQASSGTGLLVRGTRLPVRTSSHFAETSASRVFEAPSFAALPAFARPLDDVVVSAGFRSGCAVPIMRGPEVIGALAISCAAPVSGYGPHIAALTAVSGMIALALRGRSTPAGPRVLVLHEDALVAHGLAKLVETGTAAECLVCESIDEAVELLADEVPDLVLCDDWVGGTRVDGFLPRLRGAGSSAPVLVVASHDTPENLAAAVQAGAAAYLPRASAARSLSTAVAALRSGRTLLPAAAQLQGDATQRLTEREREIVVCLEEGLRMKQIALRFGISESTAKCHTRNVFRKLAASSRAEAVREARRQGVLV